MIYQWKGYNLAKEKITGDIEAPNIFIARALLIQKGIELKKIRKKLNLSWHNKAIRIQSVTLFTRQTATLLKSGVSLNQSFEIFATSYPKNPLNPVLLSLQQSLTSGLSFSESLAKHPNYFNSLYCNLIRVAEKTATLDTILERIALYRKKNDDLKKNIKKSLSYPLVVLSVALIITSILLIVVIPQFKDLFDSFGAELPFLTQYVLSFSGALKNHWKVGLFSILSLVSSFHYFKKTSTLFTEKCDQILLNIPLIGSILSKVIFARFAKTLALTSSSGLPLIESLETIAHIVANRIYIKSVSQIRDLILSGANFSHALEKVDLFPTRMVHMLRIGEETGKLCDMLLEVSDFYEKEVDEAISQLNLFLEPCIMIGLGILIGILLIALYIPIFKLGTII